MERFVEALSKVSGLNASQLQLIKFLSLPNQSLQESPSSRDAKAYSRSKLWLGVVHSALLFVFALAFVVSGFSRTLGSLCAEEIHNAYISYLAFVFLLGFAELLVGLPFRYYAGFILEHKYRLSNQSFLDWLREGSKEVGLSILIGTPLLVIFYYCLRTFSTLWWLPVGATMFIVSVLLARIAPVVILPLFYKLTPLPDGSVGQRILSLCDKLEVRVQGVFVFDLSKNTKKANAAFAGLGKSKRIILGDTLVNGFADDEVETVFAHELGHYRLHHIWMSLLVGAASSFFGLYLTAQLYAMSLAWFGYHDVADLGALPVLALWLAIYSMLVTPMGNALSRAHERAADRYAVRVTGKGEEFVRALRKLATLNLADQDPHPFVEFMFHSHPSIKKRIHAVEAGTGQAS